MTLAPRLLEQIGKSGSRQRLIDTATRLIGIPSPTGNARAVSDEMAQLLQEDGFKVERFAGGHPTAPAVVVRLESGKPGRTLQFNGHLDTVHLPFVPPEVVDGNLTGSGASDMKGGVAAAIEAVRILRDTGTLSAGSVLLTAHDLHEAPWGLGQQLDSMIREGIVGDAVLLPEPLYDRLPLVGRGAATWKVTFARQGAPVHEVMRPPEEPSVIAAGAQLITQLESLGQRLAALREPLAGTETVFIGQLHSGEIFNQYPQECRVEGTRRWLPGTARADVEREFRALVDGVARDSGTQARVDFIFIRDAFRLNEADALVSAFQESYRNLNGQPLATGSKPFCDDGNSFWGLRQVPAITHGPRSGGQHTLKEWASIDDLMRVARLYALTALRYCQGERGV
jgi:acetylornithine deacetylase/succinyl-diaminopimelate desuccinylase-like protein